MPPILEENKNQQFYMIKRKGGGVACRESPAGSTNNTPPASIQVIPHPHKLWISGPDNENGTDIWKCQRKTRKIETQTKEVLAKRFSNFLLFTHKWDGIKMWLLSEDNHYGILPIFTNLVKIIKATIFIENILLVFKCIQVISKAQNNKTYFSQQAQNLLLTTSTTSKYNPNK